MPKAKQLPRVHRYTLEFKLSAVRLSSMSSVQVQQVAEALDIHPFMLSRWRKEVREGRLRGKNAKIKLNSKLVRELKQLAELRQRYALLKEEHELLKKAVRFCSQVRPRSSPSSTAYARPARSRPPVLATGSRVQATTRGRSARRVRAASRTERC
jgi:transposase